jgi:hypothetical protein
MTEALIICTVPMAIALMTIIFILLPDKKPQQAQPAM